jgi:hypothetical protein
MISKNTGLSFFDHQIKAFAWVGTVPQHIPKAIDSFYLPLGDVVKNHCQRFKIRMYITYYRKHIIIRNTL